MAVASIIANAIDKLHTTTDALIDRLLATRRFLGTNSPKWRPGIGEVHP